MDAGVKRVLFYGASPRDETVSLVEFSDGTFGVAVEGTAVGGPWREHDLEECLRVFASLVGWGSRSIDGTGGHS